MFILSNMGKDHEFLEAARNGNITVVEKILNQKAKRTGPLASLRRGPGANVRDSSGYSALHHAALNGHIDIVRLLLVHDASPDLPDSRGSSPLHLAAWAGHQDIVKLFLTHPHRPANPNLQTIENETPLHCAAQHGHTGALTTLLAHGANPNVVNSRNETPLDLAAQYGRLQAVQMLIRAHPELLLPFKSEGSNNKIIISHSPLHSASRNGHKCVVEVLLAAGVNVNLKTPSGTALHEAALCGKDGVVRTLLDAGADLDATDCEGRTALNILEEFPPHVTRGIVSVINNHRNSMTYDSESDEVRDNHVRKNHNTTPMSLGSSYENNRGSPVQSYFNSHHDMTTSPSSSMGSLGPSSPSPRPRASTGDLPEFYITMAPAKPNSNNSNSINMKSSAPKKPPRRNLSASPTSHNSLMSMSADSYSDNIKNSRPGAYEYICMARTGGPRNEGKDKFNRAYSVDQYVEMRAPVPAPRNLITANYENTTLKSYNPNRKLKRNRDNYEPFSIDFNKDKNNSAAISSSSSSTAAAIINCPTSPTHYQQPPTPEHPPPSASQAEKFIHERIRPLSQEYKRRSGILQQPQQQQQQYQQQQSSNLIMMESGTSPPEPLCPSLCASSGSISSSVSISDHSISTDCVEEFIGDVPFAGLFKGSTMTLNNANLNYSQLQLQQQQQHQQQPFYAGSGGGNTKINQHDRPRTLQSQQQQQYHQHLYQQHHQYPDYSGKFYRGGGGGGGVGGGIGGADGASGAISEFQKGRSHSFGGILDDDFSLTGENTTADNSCNNEERKTNSSKKLQNNFRQYLNRAMAAAVSAEANKENAQNGSTGGGGGSVSGGDCGSGSGGDIDDKSSVTSTSSSSSKLFRKTLKQRTSSEEVLSPFNEEEAWAKISEIMESFGSGILSATTDEAKFRRNSANAGDGTRHSNCKNSYNDENDGDNNSSKSKLRALLSEHNLGYLEKVLIENGFDNIKFLNGILDDSDLITMNIPTTDKLKLMDIIKTLPAAQSLPVIHNSNNNSILNVDQWLRSIQLCEYSDIFKKHLYTNMEGVCRVWEVELQTVLEINKVGHRKRILHSVSTNRNIKSDSTIEEINADLNTLKANIMELRDDFIDKVSTSNEKQQQKQQQQQHQQGGNNDVGTKTTSNTNNSENNASNSGEGVVVGGSGSVGSGGQPQNKGTPSMRHSGNKKNRPAPKPPQRIPSLEIRAPSELLLGLPSNLRTQWRHSATTLINSSVKYDVYYLGSTVVKELRGTESTRKSIQKLKRDDRISLPIANTNQSQQNLLTIHQQQLIIQHQQQQQQHQQLQQQQVKRQPVRLSISHRGVEFINIESQNTICEHEIRNINCACQDADDLSHFAYITKDSDMNTHYCHVFNVDSMDLATEIILTLGQAFEVAYQLALRATSPKQPSIRASILSNYKMAVN